MSNNDKVSNTYFNPTTQMTRFLLMDVKRSKSRVNVFASRVSHCFAVVSRSQLYKIGLFTLYYETNRLIIRSITMNEAPIYKEYLEENKMFLSEWEPKRDQEYYFLDNIKKRIDEINRENDKEIVTSKRLFVFKKEENSIIGEIGISNIVYGAFLSCHLGYKLSEKEINHGYMKEALHKIIEICFKELKLHRIEANIMPKNARSEKVLVKLGFRKEGKSESYLKINGKWEDHNHWVMINKEIE